MGRPKTQTGACSVGGCESPKMRREYCAKHYMRWYRSGDPLHTGTPKRGVGLHERFWASIDQSGGSDSCWTWTAGGHVNGYGELRAGRRLVRAHRLAWEIANGPIPDRMHVLHSCDNPPCCNPLHLSVGTNTDNHRDMVNKQRHVVPAPVSGDEWYKIHKRERAKEAREPANQDTVRDSQNVLKSEHVSPNRTRSRLK